MQPTQATKATEAPLETEQVELTPRIAPVDSQQQSLWGYIGEWLGYGADKKSQTNDNDDFTARTTDMLQNADTMPNSAQI